MSETVLLWILGGLAGLEVYNTMLIHRLLGRFDEHTGGHFHVIEDKED